MVFPERTDGRALGQAYAFEMLSKLNQVVARSKQKAVQEVLLLKGVPERVDDYMAEAAACFRYGFNKACLAVCRAALEQILRWKIERDRDEKALQRNTSDDNRGQKSLYELIKDAQKWHYLDNQLIREAHEIRMWGNGAVHDSKTKRDFRGKAEKALMYSKRILHRLCS